MKAPLPPNESRRLETLRGYDVLDTLAEPAFDDLTLLAAQICQVPIALISLVDENRQWFKSALGLSATETSRDLAFSAHAILYSHEMFEVRDAQLDARFADNPLVTADPHIRFYAGAPLVTPDGLALGTLCVIDRVPRVLSIEQKTALRALSHTVIAQLELRRTLAENRRTQEQLQSLNASLEQKVESRTAELRRTMEVLRESEADLVQFKYALDHALDGIYIFHPDTLRFVDVNQGALQQVGYSEDELLRMTPLDIQPEFTEPSFRAMLKPLLDGSMAANTFETVHRHKDGHDIPMEIGLQLVRQGGQASRYIAFSRDITERRASQAKIKRLTELHAALGQCRQAIVRCTSEDELFLQICRAAVQLGGMKLAWVGVVQEASQLVKPVAWYGAESDYLEGIHISVNADEPAGRGVIGTAIRENRPVWIQDFQNDPRLAPWHERGARSGWGAAAGLPLLRKGKVIGAFSLYAGEVNAFDEVARNLLMEMARDIGHALDHYSLQTERKQAEEKLRESEARLRCLIEMSSDFFWETDVEHRLTLRSESKREAAESVFQQSPSVGLRRWEIPYLSPDEAGWQAHHELLDAHLPFRNFEISRPRANGAVHHIAISGDPVFDAAGHFKGYRGVGADITARKQMEAQVRQLAFYDPLTQLPNRRLFNDRLNQAMAASKRSACYSALMFLDLDNFKPLNDTHGHVVGDLLLIEAADRLKSCVREMDTVARFGGDEFVVMLSDLNADKAESISQAEIVAEKIRTALSGLYLLTLKHEGKADTTVEHHCTASIGVALFIHHEASQGDILKRADTAMYQAKEAGRNLIRFYESKACVTA